MSRDPRRWLQGQDWVPLYLVSLMLVALLLVIAAVGQATKSTQAPDRGVSTTTDAPRVPPLTPSSAPTTSAPPTVPDELPGGVRTIFARGRMLVAYYGTAGTGSLGVLGD